MAADELREWLQGREAIHDLAIRFPPGAVVTSKEESPLLIPAPGVEGEVVSYFEDGCVGVLAPMARTVTSPITGNTAEEGELIKGECRVESLTVLRYGRFTPDDVREAISDA